LAAPPHWFWAADIEPADLVRSTGIFGSGTVRETDGTSVRDVSADVRLPGAHNRENLAAALAAAIELGAGLEAMAAVVPSLELPAGRFESFGMAGGTWRIIYDAYNANASGTIAALDALAAENGERTIAVLGSMAELGDESVSLHERVGDHAAKTADVVLVSGDHADALARGARGGGLDDDVVVHVPDNAAAANWLRNNARSGDVVLLKGSRKYKLEEILEDLQA
jgi:UDP-N-acetylmuramoyl-tripeptide--D-alanyl-D-alanine ligase